MSVAGVVFREEDHSYTVGGVRLPSVTQILARLFDFSMVNADVLAAKAALGTAVHLACELDDADDLNEESLHASVRPYLDGYRLFKRHKLTRVVATEQVIHNPIYGYAGKYDLLTEFDDALWLVDWKTPLTISRAVGLQTAAYAKALPAALTQGRAVRRAALQLSAEGTYRLHEFKDPNDWPVFAAFATAHNWTERNMK